MWCSWRRFGIRLSIVERGRDKRSYSKIVSVLECHEKAALCSSQTS